MILIDTQKEEFSKLKDIKVFGKDDEEQTFNRDLLIIGLGGTGCKVLTSIKGMISEDVTADDNINLLYIDSDIQSMQATIEDSKQGIGLNALEVMSIYRPNLETILSKGINNNPVHPNLANWTPVSLAPVRSSAIIPHLNTIDPSNTIYVQFLILFGFMNYNIIFPKI